jgi:alkanesulfonate monooxygenase SsuD/methylene tetrahydromethanopterin reductase-like flavin-dependent oxidoreductase (luciferase family)
MRVAELEFGCSVLPSPDPWELVHHAVDAHRRGYDRFWVPDQTFLPDPFLLLSRIADRAPLDLGLALTNPFSRHPVQIARAMATLCRFDEGERSWILGIGKGNSNLVLHPLGYDEGATSRRLATAIDLIKRLLAGERVEPDGKGFLAAPVALELDPVACPVFIGTRGPLTLTHTAGVADGFITESLFQPHLVKWTRERFAGQVARPHVAWQSIVPLDPGEPIPMQTRAFAAMLMRTTAPTVLELLGVPPSTRERIAARALVEDDVSDDDVRRFVAVGTSEELREVVWNAYTAGITSWSSIFVGPRSTVDERIARFADEVMTPVRERIRTRRVQRAREEDNG